MQIPTRRFGIETARNRKYDTQLKAATDVTATSGLIDTLRSAAMQLHTTQQAPKEGGVEVEKPKERYVPNHDDYLAFLVDSLVVYEAFEEIVNEWEEMTMFRDTGLERTEPLRVDIDFLAKEYSLSVPEAGAAGKGYVEELRRIRKQAAFPKFMCHYYNFYFAHTAGGRMIGKQMAALLLDKKTLEFYKVSLCMLPFFQSNISNVWYYDIVGGQPKRHQGPREARYRGCCSPMVC